MQHCQYNDLSHPAPFRCLELKGKKKKKKGTTSNPDLKEAHEIYVPTQLTRSYPNEVKITGYGGGGVQFPWQQAGSGSFSHKSAFTIEFFARLKREEEKTHLDALTRACAHWTSLYQKQNPGWESQQKLWRPRWGGKGGGQSLSSFFSSHRGSVFFTMKQKLAKSRSVSCLKEQGKTPTWLFLPARTYAQCLSLSGQSSGTKRLSGTSFCRWERETWPWETLTLHALLSP